MSLETHRQHIIALFKRTAFLAAMLLAATSCERRSQERVLGDYGSQPRTIVTSLPGHNTPDVRRVVESAKKAVVPVGDRIWPEPSGVVERDAQWDVWFEYRRKLIEVNGKQVVREQKPESVMVEVRKSDLSARLVPGR